MLIFGVTSFVSFLLACFYSFFSLSLQCSFSLSSSACFPPLALTRGYSFLGWAETASLYNTDRLLCNQIPSVATSEDSLSRFLHHTHTHAHVGTHMHVHTHHICASHSWTMCVCSFLCTMTRVLAIVPPDSFLACREEVTRVTFTTSCFFPPIPVEVQRSLSSGISMFVLWLCVSARPWLLYQTGDSGL